MHVAVQVSLNQNEETLLWSSEQVTVCVSLARYELVSRSPIVLRKGLEACTDE